MIEEQFRVPLQVASHASEPAPLGGSGGERREGQPQRPADNHVLRRFDPEVAANDVVSDLVILRPTDAVDEEIGDKKSQKHCCGQGTGVKDRLRLLETTAQFTQLA